MKQALGLGLALTVLVTLVGALVWGRGAVGALAGFGLLATGLHAAALASLLPVLGQPFGRVMGRVAVGMGLRLLGAAVWVAGAVTVPELVPPLPSAVGYVSVLIPLLFTEARLFR